MPSYGETLPSYGYGVPLPKDIGRVVNATVDIAVPTANPNRYEYASGAALAYGGNGQTVIIGAAHLARFDGSDCAKTLVQYPPTTWRLAPGHRSAYVSPTALQSPVAPYDSTNYEPGYNDWSDTALFQSHDTSSNDTLDAQRQVKIHLGELVFAVGYGAAATKFNLNRTPAIVVPGEVIADHEVDGEQQVYMLTGFSTNPNEDATEGGFSGGPAVGEGSDGEAQYLGDVVAGLSPATASILAKEAGIPLPKLAASDENRVFGLTIFQVVTADKVASLEFGATVCHQ
jgi:hypothetical protein